MGNRISTTPEPVIMTTAFLEEKVMQNMVNTQDLNISELQKLVKIDGLEYDVVFSLDLEHQSLVNIDELWRFKLLTKLELPNNYLERIEGLEFLVNLQSLDLSFNFIKCICNLENLINLIHLNLTSNEIVALENLDLLEKLETLLIRHNKIKSFDNVYYLTQFSNLSCLAIDENPLMQETDAIFHIIAVLPQLKYLDFNGVTSDQIKKAFDKFPLEKVKSICIEEAETEFKCDFLHTDKEAYVEALANGQGFQSFLLCDKNYQLLHSFSLASKISQDHCSKVTEICDKWHETGHKYYQQIQHEKLHFLMMVSKAKEFSLEVSQKEELKFIDFKENIPKELCFIYHQTGPDDEKDEKVADFKKTCELHLQSTFRSFMNSSCLCVDLMCNMCKVYEKEITLLNAKYIQEVIKFNEDLMNINNIFAEKLQDFYFGLHDSGFDISSVEDEELLINDSAFLQLIQKKDLIKMTLEVASRIHSTMLKERINDLKMALHNDLMETVDRVSEEAFIRQSELTRNTVIFCNKQTCFIDKLFSKK